jgi:transcriptional regulator with XRE-family HTH domain
MGREKVPSREELDRGQRIQAALDVAGKNQTDLAKAFGLPPSTVNRWIEKGATPRKITWSQVAEAIGNGTTAAWLSLGDGAPPDAAAAQPAARAQPTLERHVEHADAADAVFAVLDDQRVAPVESEERAELRKIAGGIASRFGARETIDHLVKWLLGHRLDMKGKSPIASSAAEDAERAQMDTKRADAERRGIVIQPKPRKR